MLPAHRTTLTVMTMITFMKLTGMMNTPMIVTITITITGIRTVTTAMHTR